MGDDFSVGDLLPSIVNNEKKPSIGRNGGAATGERIKGHRKGKSKSSHDKHTTKGSGTKTKARSKPGFYQR